MALVDNEQLTITVRNTFLHVTLPETPATEVDGDRPPTMRRAATVPVTCMSEVSTAVDEEYQEDQVLSSDVEWEGEDSAGTPLPSMLRLKTHDPYEAGIGNTPPLPGHIDTSDHTESPADCWQPHTILTNSCGTPEFTTAGKRPSFFRMRTHDFFESPVIPNSQAADALSSVAFAPSITNGTLPAETLQHTTIQISVEAQVAPMMRASGKKVVWAKMCQEEFSAGPAAQAAFVRTGFCKTFMPKPLAGRTTIMLRNLPNNYTRSMLMGLLDSAGFAGKYDFVYMPMDFRTYAALGYSFVNLVSFEDAERFQAFFDGFSRWSLPSSKTCSASWSEFQGLEAHVARYRNSPLMHEVVPDSYRPVLLANGKRIPFPPPTRKIKPPRQGTERMLV